MATFTDPNAANENRTQLIALFLIVLAATCIGVGEKFAWRDLVNFALTFGGGGVGILTGSKLHQPTQPINNNEGGQMTVNTTPASTSNGGNTP